MSTITIGTVAKRAGLAAATIRYYEQLGLIPPPSRSKSGYRQYDPGVVRRLHFILRWKSLGFTLDEIRELLDIRAIDGPNCSSVLDIANAKLRDVETKIEQLEEMRFALQKLVCSCDGDVPAQECNILSAMRGDGE